MRLPETKLIVTIVDKANSQVCAGNCGGDWSLPEILETAQQRINQRFDKQVNLEYIDLLNAEDSENIRNIRETVKDMPLPVLLADGRPRITGAFDMRQLLDVIETCLEVKL
jgi:hypothetical protein